MSDIYFAGSIRGGRADAGLYRELIDLINETDRVLTEHVGDLSRSVLEQEQGRDFAIWEKDTTMLRACDMVIAECTVPSLGVGYELAMAEALQKPCVVLYRPEDTQLSAMIKGDPYFKVFPYHDSEEAKAVIRKVLEGRHTLD